MEYHNFISSLFFKSSWVEQLLQDCKREESEHGNTLMLPKEGCQVAWNITVFLGCEEFGVPGLVCLLVERYLYLTFLSVKQIPDPVIRAVNIGNTVDRIVLTIGCVALLVVKMTDPNINARASRLRSVLLRYNQRYPLEEIIQTEFDIFKILGFRIPLWNTADIAEALALEFNLPKRKVQRVPLLTDMVEYLKRDIDTKMRSSGFFTSKGKYSNNIRSLHLATAAVAAVVAGEYDYRHLLTDLSILIKVPRNYLKSLRDVIITGITFVDDD